MARDTIHFIVREALEKEGWIVTDDPMSISVGKTSVQIDLAAEKVLFAEREKEYIAVEIKSFEQPSLLNGFYEVLGQYLIYKEAIAMSSPERTLFLALSRNAYKRVDEFPFLRHRVVQYDIKMIVVDIDQKQIHQWFK